MAASLHAAQNQPAPAASGYAGSETCQPCHEDIHKAFQRNAHIAVETNEKRGFAKRACESCHGPAAKHAETADPADIVNPAKLRPAQTDKSCLGCHRNQVTNVGRIDRSHAGNEVSCVTCHPVHQPKRSAFERQTTRCGTCHSNILARFQKPHRHRLQEGAMSCVDCHNPHRTLITKGSWNPAFHNVSMKEPNCFRCHGDKRGPFTFEHAPMRYEGCMQCHEPHGSPNPRMLTRHEVRFQCLECHSNIGSNRQVGGGIPPAFHDLRNPRFRQCTVCHVKIHGSHADRDFLR